ncbi:MAG TPA: hypothetical protein VG734_13800 [Lacunisphaera sp.]|nr:hypothetical protein [Lacunisphaera sp.]
MGASKQSPEKQLDAFIAKFAPEHQRVIRAARRILQKRFPAANELVYDNYNFFVIGCCSTLRPSDGLVSIAAAANGVGVCFIYGAKLDDPHGLLSGSGKQTRFLRLKDGSELLDPRVESLLAAADAQARVPMPAGGKGQLIIQSISAKQRPRRKQ